MSVKKRIKDFIKSEEMGISEFERSIYVKNGYVNSISKSIGIDKLNLVLEKYPNLNLYWLLTGKGAMLKNLDENQSEATSETTLFYREMIKEKDAEIKKLNREIGALIKENEQLKTENETFLKKQEMYNLENVNKKIG